MCVRVCGGGGGVSQKRAVSPWALCSLQDQKGPPLATLPTDRKVPMVPLMRLLLCH